MKRLIVILFIGGIVFSSCKKKDDAAPDPSANTDNVDMGASLTTTIDVLANDSYKGTPKITITNNFTYGTLVVNTDKTVTFTSRNIFYGTTTLHYKIEDDNGSSTGNIVVTRGTSAQAKTYDIINNFSNETGLALYSVDGDTSRIYKPTYLNCFIGYLSYNSEKLSIETGGIMPSIGNNAFSIVSDGNVYVVANNGSNVVFTVVDYFTASAKKLDGSGYMTVKGYTIQYDTHTMVFTTPVQ